MRHLKPTTACRGFSLVEVMIALIIICVGMLGIAKLQALALSSTGISRTRALAALEASSIADAMRSDRDYWGSTPPATTAVDTTQSPISITSADGALQAAATSPPNCLGSSCSAVNMAGYDLSNWASDLANVLPGSTASIACNLVNAVENCTITLNWQENTVTANTQEAQQQASSGSSFQAQTYQLVVDP